MPTPSPWQAHMISVIAGRYRLQERVAVGWLGDVWRVHDELDDRIVAAKLFPPSMLEEPGFTERFLRAARVWTTVTHPGVIRLLDCGASAADGAFLIMEYVEGESLAATLAEHGALAPDRTGTVVAQIADALHAIHSLGIVYGDLKLRNVLLRPDGTVVLTDSGIAHHALTGSGDGPGAHDRPTPLADIYALGVVAYHCLTGRPPFEAESAVEVAARRLEGPPPALPGSVPPAISSIVERALATDPEDRWPSAGALAEAARRATADH